MGDTDPGLGIQPVRSPAGPAVASVACATCGAAVDPLRADRVSIRVDGFLYFCSSACHDGQGGAERARARPPHRESAPPATRELEHRRQAAALADVGGDGISAIRDRNEPMQQVDIPAIVVESPLPEPVAADLSAPSSDVGAVLLGLAVAGGLLGVGLALAGDSTVALSARVVLVLVGCGALVTQYLMAPRDPTEPHPVALLAAPAAASVAAIAGRLTADPEASSATTLAGLIVASTAGGVSLLQRARRPLDEQRRVIAEALDISARRVLGDDTDDARARDLRPGEEILIETGELVPVDATITAGTATVLPWLGAKATESRREGDPIAAGAQVVEGRLRAVAGWTGNDRAWIRLTNDPRRRADVTTTLARSGRLLAERGALVAATVAALMAYASNHSSLGISLFAVAAYATIANAGVAQIGALHVARGVMSGLSRGIAYRTADSFDRAGRVTMAAFCARGTLLLGEPDVANIEPFGPHDAERVLALIAGAESGASNPMAMAVQRAARDRGVRPDAVRSPTLLPGLGVTAVASSGEPLVVGSRGLMLRERVSIATAESKITDLETMGRSVVLVALGGRLVGVIGLQDGLRPGARAAVQHLLDVGVEPVLLSVDSRETCEAIGRALDIEHIRPEVLPTERSDEIRRLADGGAMVAVLGRSPNDDAALAAADLAVALGCAGSSSAEWSIQLASDDVKDAALAIRLAHGCRSEARLGLTIALAPGIAGAAAVAFALAPPALAPLCAIAGTFAALVRFRSAS